MSFYFYDLSGGVNNAESKTTLGLNTKKVYWAEGENVEIYQNKGIIRQNGNMLLCNLGKKVNIIGVFDHVRNQQRHMLVYTAQGELYALNYLTGVLTCLKNDFTRCENVAFCNFLGGVVVSNGVDEPVFVDMTDKNSPVKSTNAKTSDNIDIRGLAMCAYGGRLWLASGSTLYYSALGKYDDWQTESDAGFIADFHSDYSKITALCQYREYLAIYKQKQIYFLSGTSESNFSVQSFADCGVDGHNAVITVNNRQYFFNGGVFNLAQAGELGQIVMSSNIANPVKQLTDSYKKADAEKICIVPYEEKNQIWFFVPQKNSVNLSTVWIYDFLNNAWFVRKIPQDVLCAGKVNSRPVTCTSDGKVYSEDISNTFCGEPIKFSWKSPFFTFNTPGKKKVVDRFEFVLDDMYDNVFQVCTQKNYEELSTYDEQNIKTYNPLNLLWDDEFAYWADDNNGFCWSKSTDCRERAIISDKNSSVQICVSGSEVTHNCCIIGLEFDEFDYY